MTDLDREKHKIWEWEKCLEFTEKGVRTCMLVEEFIASTNTWVKISKVDCDVYGNFKVKYYK